MGARRVYADHNATTPVAPEVAEQMVPYLTETFGNASSIHSFGQKARAGAEKARQQVADLIGASPKEIVFTSGGTEADNHAIRGVVGASPAAGGTGDKERKHIVSTAIEHNAVLNTCEALASDGVETTFVEPDSAGAVDPNDIRAAITPDTVLITVMLANNELGTVQPVAGISAIAREHKIPFHTDAVQAAGKIPVNVPELGVDLLSLSAHKLYGPKGVGALWIRSGLPLQPLIFGGRHQHSRRAGTENVAGVVGFGAAAELAQNHLADEGKRLSGLRDRLEAGIIERVPHSVVNGAGSPRTPNTTNIYFDYVEGEALVIALDLKGIACSTGAACSSGVVEPSHVLTAIGLPDERARASLRFSLGRLTQAEDVARILETLPGVVEKLRDLSPAYKKAAAAAI